MKAELSHYGFTQEDSYTGVYLQQGRMITDRDFNALCDRLKAQLETLGDKSIGTGIPKDQGLLHAFQADGSPATLWNAELRPEGGWVVADGVAGNLVSETPPLTIFNQPDLPKAGLLLDQEPGFYYADIWDEVVNAIDDNDLLDSAFHGADTCFITRRRVQIKKCSELSIRPIQEGDENETLSCGHEIDPQKLASRGNGVFKVNFKDFSAASDPCNPCEDQVSVQTDTGNFLYRFEIHAVDYDVDGRPLKLAIKWSKENGAHHEAANPDALTFAQDYSYEMYDAVSDLEMGLPAAGFPHVSERYKAMFHGGNSGGYIPAFNSRRWDGYAIIDSDGVLVEGFHRGVTLRNGNVAEPSIYKLGNLIKLNLGDIEASFELENKKVLTGDYWLALGRSQATEKIRALSDLPLGIQHHYCLLGYSEDGRTFSLSPGDKRRLHFPELTCIHADDVNYAPHEDCTHAEGATNVQEVLDLLCAAISKRHWNIKMSAGTGQEAFLGESLPGSIRVLVQDEDGLPVQNATVRFTVMSPDNGVDTLRNGANTSKTYIEVMTNADGHASAQWELHGRLGEHLVHARVINAPQGQAGAITFSALAKNKSPFPLIEKITWTDGSQFRNDWRVSLDKLAKGFTIHCLDDIMQDLVSQDVLSLHMEFFKSAGEFMDRHEVIICGEIETDTRSITFTPHRGFVENLFSEMNYDRFQDCAPEGIRFRINLLGRFLFDTKGRPFDAFVPGMPAVESLSPYKVAEVTLPTTFEDLETDVILTPDINTPYSDAVQDFQLGQALMYELQLKAAPKGTQKSAAMRTASSASAGSLAAANTSTVKNLAIADIAEATKFNVGQAVAAGVSLQLPAHEIVRPSDFSGASWMTTKRRIALNYLERGLGHPSDLQAWFYVFNPKWEFDDVEDEVVDVISVNIADEAVWRHYGYFDELDVRKIIEGKGRWHNMEQLVSAIGYEDKTANLEKRLSFAAGYEEPSRDDERYKIYANTEKDSDKLHAMGLITCKQVSKLLAGQSNWTSHEQIYKALKITGDQLSRVQGRIIIDAPSDDKPPKDEPPKDEPKEPHNEEPKNDELIPINDISAKDLAKIMGGERSARLAKMFIQKIRAEFKRKHKHGFRNFEDIIDVLTEAKAPKTLIDRLKTLENRLFYGGAA